MRQLPRVGITIGDPRGIGPEIISAALSDSQVSALGEYIVIGPSGLVQGHPIRSIGDWTSGGSAPEAGRLSGLAIEAAVRMALAGELDAVVTAPIDKAAFHEGGWHYPGHTEMLQDLAGAPAVSMMMAAEKTRLGAPLRVVLATTHLALRDVPKQLTADLLATQATLTSQSLNRWWGLRSPKIALCAFNPHASDGGLFGDEEERVYRPAIQSLRERGVDVYGPVPADTVFSRALNGEFDAVIAPYHDVGMAPFKTVSFGTGVNVTLGLPFPRTSPDHGTAIDIAGRGSANASSMIEAIRLAVHLAGDFDTFLEDS